MGDPKRFASGDRHAVRSGVLHLLAYTDDDVDEHPQLAQTRKREIEGSGLYKAGRDSIQIIKIRDLGKLKKQVEALVKAAKKKGRKTVEFSIWSHGGLDGPIAPKATTRAKPITTGDGLTKQLSMDEWMAIDFNWHPRTSFAAFYGCRSGIRYGDSYAKAFALNFLKASRKAKKGLFAAAGQPWFTMPSLSNRKRLANLILDYDKNANLYSVAALSTVNEDGSKDYSRVGLSLKARTTGSKAYKMRIFYHDGKKYECKRHWPNVSQHEVGAMAFVPYKA